MRIFLKGGLAAWVLLAGVAGDAAAETVTCNTIGTQTYCSDGTTYNRVGTVTYDNRGNSFNRVGRYTYGSDGSSCTTIGSQTYCRSGTGGSASRLVAPGLIDSE